MKYPQDFSEDTVVGEDGYQLGMDYMVKNESSVNQFREEF
jgi:hypothetical protein